MTDGKCLDKQSMARVFGGRHHLNNGIARKTRRCTSLRISEMFPSGRELGNSTTAFSEPIAGKAFDCLILSFSKQK